ncbi:LegC family aminotransferase [Candidatus Uabimicrobium amorphum]|uniref:Aminotransferase DegT n=1 Tax=Uabimicrobium amorphum TaxID=2596890 RepID=A0A5S9ITC7_UABAM|nr:LegC family aminotransferase [Candidatus Uabimicrobium amorphum]BBM87739.1 aminotransferase DegT [Candidatus Uabimicrobium amorphum]
MEKILQFIKEIYPNRDFIPLHESKFLGNEKEYLCKCIDINFVSSVGKFVDEFEDRVASFCGTKYAVAVVNGTCALQVALRVCGVKNDEEVLIPALTFIATANAVHYLGAKPIFVDSERRYLGMCPSTLQQFLQENTYIKDQQCFNKNTNRRIAACVPMHVFGHSVEIESIVEICQRHHIVVVEDAAESLGSLYKSQVTGTFGKVGVFSFNGNKIITCGGGGAIITNDGDLAKHAKHITTTAKKPHCWDYEHDEVGYNYRLPNINAALACAQLELLPDFLEDKRKTAQLYCDFFRKENVSFVSEGPDRKSNYWLNAIILNDQNQRDQFLKYTNENKVMTRPIWKLLSSLPMYADCETTSLENAKWLEERVVNIPSSVRLHQQIKGGE